MKKYFLLAVILSIFLAGCSGKPGNEELIKSFNQSFTSFKQVGVDLSEYVEPSNFKVADSYKEGDFYVVKAIPTIRIKKDIDVAALQSFKEKAGLAAPGIFQLINMLEIMNNYESQVKLHDSHERMVQEIRTSHLRQPQGSLKAGAEFSGLESDYKFRKTDNGWMAVD